jgi:hypothetical protein
MEKENIWKTFISGLEMDLPEKGVLAPIEELIEDDTEDINGMLLKVSFDVYMFMSHNQTRYFMMQSNQRLTQVGVMSLKDALLKFNKKPRKK